MPFLTLNDQAIQILQKAETERKEAGLPHDRYELARLYDTYPNIVYSCLHAAEWNPPFEMGSKMARKIMRAEIAHIKARKAGEMLNVLNNNSKYKHGGTFPESPKGGKGTWGKKF